jgi:hypothetical protein
LTTIHTASTISRAGAVVRARLASARLDSAHRAAAAAAGLNLSVAARAVLVAAALIEHMDTPAACVTWEHAAGLTLAPGLATAAAELRSTLGPRRLRGGATLLDHSAASTRRLRRLGLRLLGLPWSPGEHAPERRLGELVAAAALLDHSAASTRPELCATAALVMARELRR